MTEKIDPINLTLTAKGQRNLFTGNGLGTLNFHSAVFGTTAWNPTSDVTELQTPIAEVKLPRGKQDIYGNVVILAKLDDPSINATIREIGIKDERGDLVAIYSERDPQIEFKLNEKYKDVVTIKPTVHTTNAQYILQFKEGQLVCTKHINGDSQKFHQNLDTELNIGDLLIEIKDLSKISDDFVVVILGKEGPREAQKTPHIDYVAQLHLRVGQTHVKHLIVADQEVLPADFDLFFYCSLPRKHANSISTANKNIELTRKKILLEKVNKQQILIEEEFYIAKFLQKLNDISINVEFTEEPFYQKKIKYLQDSMNKVFHDKKSHKKKLSNTYMYFNILRIISNMNNINILQAKKSQNNRTQTSALLLKINYIYL